MCVSCGCEVVTEDHGDSRNITLNRLQEAAQAASITVHEVVSNIQDAAIVSGEESAGEQGAGDEEDPARTGSRAEEER